MTETQVLIAYGLLVLLNILWQATGALGQLGINYLISTRDEGRTVTGVSARVERALNNSITAMVLFAPAALLIIQSGESNASSQLAAMVFLIARIVYLPAYAFGIAGIRSLAWSIGFVATVSLYLLSL